MMKLSSLNKGPKSVSCYNRCYNNNNNNNNNTNNNNRKPCVKSVHC